MTTQRKILFSGIVLASVGLAIESAARLIWWRMESLSFASRKSRGAAVLKNDGINFMKVPDEEYGYRLKENFERDGVYVNSQGFPQRDVVPLAPQAGYLRVACLGESTTFGTDLTINYPAYLREILKSNATGYRGYEVINAGVPGWVSEQVAIRVHNQISQFRPNVVILYLGWNDFQSYDPYAPLPQRSFFEETYGKRLLWKQYAAYSLKSVALLSGLYERLHGREIDQNDLTSAGISPPEKRYRFLLRNIDDIATDLRRLNPDVKIFISTLAGLWPQGSPSDWAKIPNVWWADRHHIGKEEMAQRVRELNEQLKLTAERDHLTGVVEIASNFEVLDGLRLHFDWAHMNPDGYELMAWMMFMALQNAKIIEGQMPARYNELLATYRLSTPVTGLRVN